MTGSGTVERIYIAPEAEAEMEEQTTLKQLPREREVARRRFRDIFDRNGLREPSGRVHDICLFEYAFVVDREQIRCTQTHSV